MQFPFDWYAYVVSGFLWGLLILMIPPDNFRNSILSVIYTNSVLWALPIVVLSYLLGSVADICIVRYVRWFVEKIGILHPPRNLQVHEQLMLTRPENTDLGKALSHSYLHMVFLRSIIFPLVAMTIIGINAVLGSDWSCIQKISSILIMLTICGTIAYQWIYFRDEFFKWREAARKDLSNRLNVQRS